MSAADGPNTTFTYVSNDIWMGEFRLPPDAPAWKRANVISDRAPLIAFPRTTVRIEQEGRGSVVADPTRAVAYPAGQPYRRGLVSADGDSCSFLTFSHALAAEAAAAFDPAAEDPDSYAFPFVAASIDREDYVEMARTRWVIATGDGDAEQVRESLYWLVARVVADGYTDGGLPPIDRRPATARAHVDVADTVRAEIGRRLDANDSLDDLASAACMSPFHMSRVFRERTGRSVHGYRTEVRLRASLEPIASGGRLADVAAAVGFANQAHLTDRFRRAYGITPHAWRSSLDSRHQRREMRTIVESSERVARIA